MAMKHEKPRSINDVHGNKKNRPFWYIQIYFLNSYYSGHCMNRSQEVFYRIFTLDSETFVIVNHVF